MRNLWSDLQVQICSSLIIIISLLITVIAVPGIYLIYAWILFVFCLVVLLYSNIIIIINYRNKLPKIFMKEDKYQETKINQYMYNLIDNNEKIAIWTRDFTWAQDFKIKTLLLKKAINNELCIYVPTKNRLTDELKQSNAEIIEYSFLFPANVTPVSVPNSRFTIINYGKDGARAAIGRKDSKGNHVIEELSTFDHPAFAVFSDLLNIVRLAYDHHEHKKS